MNIFLEHIVFSICKISLSHVTGNVTWKIKKNAKIFLSFHLTIPKQQNNTWKIENQNMSSFL